MAIKESTFEVTRVRMVTEIVTVSAKSSSEAWAKAESMKSDWWRIREQEVLTVNISEVK